MKNNEEKLTQKKRKTVKLYRLRHDFSLTTKKNIIQNETMFRLNVLMHHLNNQPNTENTEISTWL